MEPFILSPNNGPSLSLGGTSMNLDRGEVHLWFAFPEAISDPDLLDAYRALLTPDEEARRARFLLERSRHEFLVARALVRTTLSRYGSHEPGEWRFQKNEYGRPDLVPEQLGDPELRFNLSHTRGLMVCAVLRDLDVGVDVEDSERKTSGVAIADRFFSGGEVEDLHRLSPAHQQDRFFDYWTLQEAYIKARGMGLSLPLGGFTYRLLGGPPPRISFSRDEIDDEPGEWQFALFSPTARHRAALAVRRGEASPDLKLVLRKVVPMAAQDDELEPTAVFHL